MEIDLLRGGEHIVSVPVDQLPGKHRELPLVCVHRAYTLRWEVYPISLREPLPNFRVPLRPGDRDVILQLQPAYDDNYAHGGYAKRVDYPKSGNGCFAQSHEDTKRMRVHICCG